MMSTLTAVPPRQRQAVENTSALARMAAAIDWLTEHYLDQPSLASAAAVVDLSPHHFQRLFTRYVGVSPKKFVQHLTLNHVKASLAEASSLLDATYDAGLSGPSRLHDLFVSHEAMTPGEWKASGAGKRLTYGWHDSPFGECLIVTTERGVCGLGFRSGSRSDTLANLTANFSQAQIEENLDATKAAAEQIFGEAPGELNLVLQGTPFQLKVWEALLRVPEGQVVSYQSLATQIGRPAATRAVASAVARNRIAWLIPCHRVIRANGAISEYRWQPDRKRAMLAWEAAHIEGEGRGAPAA